MAGRTCLYQTVKMKGRKLCIVIQRGGLKFACLKVKISIQPLKVLRQ